MVHAAPEEARQLKAPPPFWRTISLRCVDRDVTARVCDNVHDFTVTLSHEQGLVTRVAARADRIPWTTCPAAIERLQQLVGLALTARVNQTVDQSHQCTHMLDLAKLALRQAQRGGQRTYAVATEATEQPDTCVSRITRDGEEVCLWQISGNTIDSPALFRGLTVTGRASWPPEVERDPDLYEAALILRRSLVVFRGRRHVTERVRRAIDLNHMKGACLTFTEAYVNVAVRPANFVDLK
jgi:hypothetical protein